MTSAVVTRSSGILLHPTSLPGPYGIGDLGPAAHWFVDQLAQAKVGWWQVLPLGPTGFGDSPYSSFSAFAGNPLLVSPDDMVRDGLLQYGDVSGVPCPPDAVDYGAVTETKNRWLERAWERFREGAAPALRPELAAFCEAESGWLEDYALFMAVKGACAGAGWQKWPEDLRRRDPSALKHARAELADAVGYQQFVQFLFRRQWEALRRYAHSRGVRFIGDIPIFVSGDSSDVWANPQLFLLDKDRRPTFVAGVPPDYFMKTGQLWGNPHYDWDAHQQTGFAWWRARIRALLGQVDVIRLDHFLGFVAGYHIPADHPTAEHGKYRPGPGAALFEALQNDLGSLPLIAEDLGLVTPEVDSLRDQFRLPGMRILQFAFGGATENRFLPHNFEHNTVVYTGTHDNNTTWGWYGEITEQERDLMHRYVGCDGSNVSWDLIRLAWMSVADYALTTLQDVLGLGTEAQMNYPGRELGNWCWQFSGEMLTQEIIARLREYNELYTRCSTPS